MGRPPYSPFENCVPGEKFSSQNHDLAFAAHISDDALTALVDMYVLDADELRTAVPQAA